MTLSPEIEKEIVAALQKRLDTGRLNTYTEAAHIGFELGVRMAAEIVSEHSYYGWQFRIRDRILALLGEKEGT